MRKICITLFCLAFACSSCGLLKSKKAIDQEQGIYRSLEEALKAKDKVQTLILFGEDLGTFPIEIIELHNLRYLNLGKNSLYHIPPEITQLQKLERLDLMYNQIETLPTELRQIKSLRWINVAFNPIQDELITPLRDAMPNCQIILYLEH